MSIYVKVFFFFFGWTYVLIFLDAYLGVKFLDHMLTLCLTI